MDIIVEVNMRDPLILHQSGRDCAGDVIEQCGHVFCICGSGALGVHHIFPDRLQGIRQDQLPQRGGTDHGFCADRRNVRGEKVYTIFGRRLAIGNALQLGTQRKRSVTDGTFLLLQNDMAHLLHLQKSCGNATLQTPDRYRQVIVIAEALPACERNIVGH